MIDPGGNMPPNFPKKPSTILMVVGVLLLFGYLCLGHINGYW